MEDLYYFVDREGQQRGPVAMKFLKVNGVNGETLVWKNGMEQWQKVKFVPELSFLVTPPPIPQGEPEVKKEEVKKETRVEEKKEVKVEAPKEVITSAPLDDTPIITQQPIDKQSEQSDQPKPERPNNHLIWSVVCLACCCMPIGAYAIYCSMRVDTLYKRGEYVEAQIYAGRAKTWALVGVVLGLLFSVTYFLVLLAIGA
jgi:hypothetical protein